MSRHEHDPSKCPDKNTCGYCNPDIVIIANVQARHPKGSAGYAATRDIARRRWQE